MWGETYCLMTENHVFKGFLKVASSAVLKIFANGAIIISDVDVIFADDIMMLFEDASSGNKR